MSTQLFDQLGEALKAQRERFGADAFDNRRRVISLLADVLPEARREIRAVASALDEGAVEALANVERRLLGMEMDRQADRLEQSHGLRADLAKQVIRTLAYALELGPAPSVYEAAPMSPQPAPAPAAEWAGLSQSTAPPQAPQQTMSPLGQSPHVVSPSHYSAQHSQHPPQQPTGQTASLTAWAQQRVFSFRGIDITRLHALIAGCAAAIIVYGLPSLTAQNQQVTPANNTGQQQVNYAHELTDVGVQPKDTLETNVGSPTPMSVPGGQRITTMQLRDFINANRNVILVDVLVDQHQITLQGARYIPLAGQPGALNDNIQAQTARALQNVTGGRRDTPLVFFCAGAACWESYNAVLRARAAGYTQLFWYRGGLASWQEAGLPMQNLPAPTN